MAEKSKPPGKKLFHRRNTLLSGFNFREKIPTVWQFECFLQCRREEHSLR